VFPEPSYPTPLELCREKSSERVELWIKNDGLSHPVYGGNKVRKAERLIAEAERRGARRILTVGATGSHHVLTSTIFARARGLGCAAVLFPQPWSEHVEHTLRASLAQGLEAYPVESGLGVPFSLARARRSGDLFVPPGGSNIEGSLAYVDALDELVDQLARAGVAPPDTIVVPLGSGGTAAGIAAGVLRRGLPTRVVGVQVVPGRVIPALARRLTRKVLGRLDSPRSRADVEAKLRVDDEQLGPGYGHPTPGGERALEAGRRIGLELDATYTAKAFAAALSLVEAAERAPVEGSPRRILYWHTLSAISLDALLESAPRVDELDAALRRLLGKP
jgi:1-aminocyclopropane-1-carboxylate deaminase/D-cysteine desulfhydrase-like pyridoxal-dependent ACC family enzyme